MSTEISPVIPFLRYRDSNAAVDWLTAVFGFEPVVVAKDDHGKVVHASLRFGSGAVMIGPAGDGPLDVRSPLDLPATSQGVYVYLADGVAAHYKQATEGGAEVVLPLADMDYGSTEYTVRDPEGHIWSFGSYLPSAE
ncbi:MAG TPA: VOC family protein [Rugosimonospora sp.]|nr:VOC family protein [Rugosimonospora sp.]